MQQFPGQLSQALGSKPKANPFLTMISIDFPASNALLHHFENQARPVIFGILSNQF